MSPADSKGRFPVSAQALQTARAGMNAEARRLCDTRAEATTAHEEGMSSRLVDMLCKELVQEFVHSAPEGTRQHQEPSPAVSPVQRASGAAVSPDRAGVSAQDSPTLPAEIKSKITAARALVEQIAAFVRSNRPALSLTLRGGMNAEVEVERTGRNEVALLVRGRQGPPAPQDLSRIRDALDARGLKLSSLSVS